MLAWQRRRVITDSGLALGAINIIGEPFAKADCSHDVATTHADRRNFAQWVRGVRIETDVAVLHRGELILVYPRQTLLNEVDDGVVLDRSWVEAPGGSFYDFGHRQQVPMANQIGYDLLRGVEAGSW